MCIKTITGFPEILPSQTIRVQPNGTKEVYEMQYGIPDISPSQVIKPSYHGGYEVYDTQNGLPSISQKKWIILEDK
ncbi:hypothetical protein [Aquiflexum lacus]|uniref:hypothetical protein n=1 Tax=Aquiflexum lacus TaxID=2483805 RepID=UPI001892E963|nr:hypothetical protein [Aquiflexum lacus]